MPKILLGTKHQNQIIHEIQKLNHSSEIIAKLLEYQLLEENGRHEVEPCEKTLYNKVKSVLYVLAVDESATRMVEQLTRLYGDVFPSEGGVQEVNQSQLDEIDPDHEFNVAEVKWIAIKMRKFQDAVAQEFHLPIPRGPGFRSP